MLAALRVNSLINTIGPAPGQLLSSNNIHPPEAANMLAQQSYALHAEHAQVRCPFLRPNKHSRVGRQCAAVLSVNAAVQEQRSIASLSSLVHGSLTETAWGQTQKSTTFPKLSANAQADVLIIGAGITGLTAALQLLRSGEEHTWHASKATPFCGGENCKLRQATVVHSLLEWKTLPLACPAQYAARDFLQVSS